MQLDVSIIIPAYNKEKSISTTIESVISSAKTVSYEIIIVNDGSTDRTSEVVRQYDSHNIKLVNQFNQGVSAARNRGVIEAKGRWIMFLDADDVLSENLFQNIKNYFATTADLIIGNFYIINDKGNKIIWSKRPLTGLYSTNKLLEKWYFKRFFIRSGNFLIRREQLDYNIFDERLSRFEDVKAYIKLLKRDINVLFVKDCFMSYLQSNCSASLALNNKFDRDYCAHLNFNVYSFWEKLISAELLSCAYSDYPEKSDYLKKKYKGTSIFIVINQFLFPIKYLVRKIFGIWAIDK